MRNLIPLCFLVLVIGLLASSLKEKPFEFTVIPNDHKEVNVAIVDGEFWVSFYHGKSHCYGTDTTMVIKTCLGGWEYGAMISACEGADRYVVDSLAAAAIIHQVLEGARCEEDKDGVSHLLLY